MYVPLTPTRHLRVFYEHLLSIDYRGDHNTVSNSHKLSAVALTVPVSDEPPSNGPDASHNRSAPCISRNPKLMHGTALSHVRGMFTRREGGDGSAEGHVSRRAHNKPRAD